MGTHPTLFFLVLISALAGCTKRSSESRPAESSEHDICLDSREAQEKKKVADYQIALFRNGDGTCGSIDIEKNGKLVYRDEEIGGHFSLGSDWQPGVKPLMRLTRKNHPDLVVSKWTGGAQCCFSLHIFHLDDQFAKIAEIEGDNSYPIIKRAGPKRLPSIEVLDDFLAYRFSSFADSAWAKVVLKFKNDHYEVAAEAMKRASPNPNLFNKKIGAWRKMLRRHETPDWPPPSMIQAITELVFTGNKTAALALIDRAWPKDLMGKNEFIASYERALSESKFYPAFAKQL